MHPCDLVGERPFDGPLGRTDDQFALHLPGYQDPWLLASNLPTARQTQQVYAKRMWIEELFGDLKKHGMDLEATQLQHADRLSRLLLAVCLLYVWLFFLGMCVIKAGWRAWLDHPTRRDLSLPRLGWDRLNGVLHSIGNHQSRFIA